MQNNKIDPRQLDVITSISLCYSLEDLERVEEYRRGFAVEEIARSGGTREGGWGDGREDARGLREAIAGHSQKLVNINQQYI